MFVTTRTRIRGPSYPREPRGRRAVRVLLRSRHGIVAITRRSVAGLAPTLHDVPRMVRGAIFRRSVMYELMGRVHAWVAQERGQGTVEYVGLILLLGVLLAGVVG